MATSASMAPNTSTPSGAVYTPPVAAMSSGSAPQGNNIAATQAANAAYFALNPNIFGQQAATGTVTGGSPGTQAFNQATTQTAGNTTANAPAAPTSPAPTTSAAIPPTAATGVGTAAAGASGSTAEGGTQTAASPPTPTQAALTQLQSSGNPPPQSGGAAFPQVQDSVDQNTPPPQPAQSPAVQGFMDSESVGQIQQQLQNQFMPQSTQAELANQLQTVTNDQNIAVGLQTQLMNMNTVMSGTETDLQNQIQAIGGFATQSQIDALTVARNKTLMTQDSEIQNQLTAQNQIVKNDTDLLANEKDMANTAFTEGTGLYQMANTIYNQQYTANLNSFNAVIKAVGYSGLTQALMQTGGQNAVDAADAVLFPNMPSGTLQGLAAQPDVTQELAQTQLETAIANLQEVPLKEEQIQAEIGASGASAAASESTTAKNNYELQTEEASGGGTPAQAYAATQGSQNDTEALSILKANRGPDGYISPATYAQTYAQWSADEAAVGKTPTEAQFEALAQPYLNPELIGKTYYSGFLDTGLGAHGAGYIGTK